MLKRSDLEALRDELQERLSSPHWRMIEPEVIGRINALLDRWPEGHVLADPNNRLCYEHPANAPADVALMDSRSAWAHGWNECRDAMIAAQGVPDDRG